MTASCWFRSSVRLKASLQLCGRETTESTLVKIIYCIKRLPALSLEEFHDYWLSKHALIVKEVAPVLRIRRYVQSHYFFDERLMPTVNSRGHKVAPYDGVTEVWWDSLEDLLAAGQTKEARAAGRRLWEDEKNFIDFESSTQFFSHEHVVIER